VSRHVAVVPVSVVDAHTAGALEYARSLTPHVLAVHFRGSGGVADIQEQWTARALLQPLVIVDVPDGDRTAAMRRALTVLRRTEQPEQITVVLPWQATGDVVRVEGLVDLSAVRVQRAPAAPY
jgi:hypothetical protein